VLEVPSSNTDANVATIVASALIVCGIEHTGEADSMPLPDSGRLPPPDSQFGEPPRVRAMIFYGFPGLARWTWGSRNCSHGGQHLMG
jgi:hypothetical protein